MPFTPAAPFFAQILQFCARTRFSFMRSAKANSPSQAAITLRHGSSSFASYNETVLGTACARHFARRLLQQAEQQLGLLAFYACVVDHAIQLDFSTALEMTEVGESTGCVFPLLLSAVSPLLSFRPKRSFLLSTRAKPWLLRDRGAATKRSCKARLRGLLRAQFAATSAWRNLAAPATDKRQRSAALCSAKLPQRF